MTQNKWLESNGACQAMADGKTKTETYASHVTWYPPAHQYPDSQPCAIKTFSASYVLQPAKKHTHIYEGKNYTSKTTMQ